ncbi:hypothetical protein ZOSMA_86G00230 [Zostera marina]|uniref:DM2 domain-containing protein n=1 Tax=Zostera marina TaxID=29655 RepID=A0A0K9NL96_ZOSMR|nr:hypothetical protein ZOSMA_86G00230 [Zostera marina]
MSALGFCSALLLTGDSSAFFTTRVPSLRFSTSMYHRGGVSTVAPLVRCADSKPAEGVEETKTTRKPRGITKPKPISPVMQEFLGVPEIPRTQALKQIWAYIKKHDLQDPADRKVIVCDDMLKKIFGGRERVGFLEIAGLINVHFIK